MTGEQSAAEVYRLLGVLGDSVRLTFEEHEGRFRVLQSSRNYPYVAHGFGSSKEGAHVSLREFILGLELFRRNDAPVFSKLRFSY